MKEEQIEKAARDLCTSDRQEQWLKDFGTACFADGAQNFKDDEKYITTANIQWRDSNDNL